MNHKNQIRCTKYKWILPYGNESILTKHSPSITTLIDAITWTQQAQAQRPIALTLIKLKP